jgi:hypothetical protein
LCLAHQHLAQLPRDLREAIGANARTKIYFQLSRDDAGYVEREVKPDLTAYDLSHLGRYTAAVRLCREGEPTQAFTLTTQPLPDPIPGRAQTVRAVARKRGTPRHSVESLLARLEEESLPRLERTDSEEAVAVRAAPGDAIGAAMGAAARSAAPRSGQEPNSQATSAPRSAARQVGGSEDK